MGSLSHITGPTVYLDANSLIYAVEDVSGLGEKMRDVFTRIDRRELRGVTSELSLAEVLVKPLRTSATTVASEYEQLLHPAGPITTAPITRRVLTEAAKLRATHGSLKLPDAIHAATALLSGCTTFLTNDNRFASVTGLPVLLLSALP